MQFAYHPDAGTVHLLVQGELYTHLYKSRRMRRQERLAFRNLRDDRLYLYRNEHIGKREATLTLEQSLESPNRPQAPSHLILSILDSQSLHKTLPFLNELGVGKLSLFYADFSQKNEKPSPSKLEKILINSSQQCGRSDLLQIEVLQHLEEVLSLYPKVAVLDFGGERLDHLCQSLPIIIGAEGGFSPREREILAPFPTYSTGENLILRAETACTLVASRLLMLPK